MRGARAVIAAACGLAAAAVSAAPDVLLPYLPTERSAAPPVEPSRGIEALAPYAVLPVTEKASVAARPLPPPAEFCADWAGPPMPPALAGEGGTMPPPECQLDAADGREAVGALGLRLEPAELTAMRPRLMQGVSLPQRRWFSAVQPRPVLSYGDRHWLYQDHQAPAVGLGHVTARAPAWGSSATIGGLQISERYDSSSNLQQGEMGYSSSVGRLNLMDPAATEGEVAYGAAAGSGTVRYGLTSSLTLEGQLQSAPGLTTRGLGTRYDAGSAGTFEAGVTQSRLEDVQAWRYRFGYSVMMADTVRLGVRGEGVDAGFGDLGNYYAGANGQTLMRSTLSAGVPLHGMGTLSGTYTSTAQGHGEATERRFGLEHSIELESKAQLAVGADRDLLSGEYGWRARLSLPVDVFMRGHWLGF